jgi:hypothetical protein
VEELIKEIEQIVFAHVRPAQVGTERNLIVEVELHPDGGPQIRLAIKDGVSQSAAENIHKQLLRLTGPRAREISFKFQMLISAQPL